MSTFGSLETGKRGIMAHQTALKTVGHNITNAATEGYSRQRVRMSPTDPLYRPDLSRPGVPGQIGTGVAVTRIERVRDYFLDKKIISSQEQFSYWETRSNYLRQIDFMYNENDGNSIRHMADKFWDAWQNLAADPANLDARIQVAQRGKNFSDHVNLRFDQLNGMRKQLNDEVRSQVQQINNLTENIASLNREIQRSLAVGDQPNDLMDQRDLLTQKLANFIDINTDLRDSDEYQIHVGGYRLVQGDVAQKLELRSDPNNNGYFEVVWPKNTRNVAAQDQEFEAVQLKGGSLKSLLDLRDQDLASEIRQLDEMTLTYAAQVNEIHRRGFAMNGKTGQDFFELFSATSNPLGNYDSAGDGVFDQTRLYQITGSEKLKSTDIIGIDGTITLGSSTGNGNISINYNATDTVSDVISRINHAEADVKARLNRDGMLELHGTADNNFVISYLEDSSYFLTQYSGLMQSAGPDQAGNVFDSNQAGQVNVLQQDPTNSRSATWQVQLQENPSATLRVNSKLLSDPASVVAAYHDPAQGELPLGNNQAALAMAALAHETLMLGGRETLGDFFANNILQIGEKEYQASTFYDTFQGELKNLEDLRSEVSGVNTDEEFTNLIKFQHGYNAASRFIATFDKLMDVLINQVGA